MKLKLGWAAILIAAIVFLVVLATRPGQAPEASSPPVATPTSAPSSTSASVPAPAATAETSPAPAEDLSQLKQQAVRIVEAYYHIDVSDTTESRLAAVTQLVPLENIDNPGNFGIGYTSCWDHARLENQLKERATVSTGSITTERVQTDVTILHMQVPGVVRQYLPSGEPFRGTQCSPGEYAFVATFDWRLTESGWVLDNFGNPGDLR